MNGPHWIKQWIADLALLNDQFRNEDGSVDFSALGREEYQFRMALITRKFSNSERAKDIFEKAKAAYEVNVERGKKGGRPKKSPQDASNGNAGVDMYDAGNGAASKSPTSCDQFTADGDIREDSQDIDDGSNSGTLESSTSANNSEARESQRCAGADSVRGTPSHRAPARQRAPFRNKEDFIQWAIDDGLDPVDAGECWEATEERGGKDADGNTVKNMKAFARQWCRTRKDNRRTA